MGSGREGTTETHGTSKENTTSKVIKGVAAASSILGAALAPATGGVSLVVGGLVSGGLGLLGTAAAGTESDSTSTNESKTYSESTGTTESDTHTVTTGTSITEGASNAITLNMHDKSIEDMLARIEKQLKRMDEFESLGMYECAAYFLSEDQYAAEVAASTYINPFNRLVIATSAPNDARIIDYVIRVNKEKGLNYEVDYLPWEEICGYIETIPGIFQKYYGILDYSDPMISEFFEIVKKYDIQAFLRLDPMVEGIEIDYPEKLQLFVMEIQRVIDKNIGRNDLFYRKMSEFNYWMDSYNANLGMILFICGDKFKYLPPYSGYDSMYGEKSNLVLSYRKSLLQILAKLQNL